MLPHLSISVRSLADMALGQLSNHRLAVVMRNSCVVVFALLLLRMLIRTPIRPYWSVSTTSTPLRIVTSKGFEAHYNPATGLVENNATYAEDRAPEFQFNKCMIKYAVPLKRLLSRPA
jgi:hypothetical protein